MIRLLEKIIQWLSTLLLLLQKNAVERQLGGLRSPLWPKVRKEYLKRNPLCEICNSSVDIDCHHVIPFHLDSKLELSGDNLITLCTPHHFLFGHLRSWRSWNKDIREDAKMIQTKIANRP